MRGHLQMVIWNKGGASSLWMSFDPRNRELSETGGHLRSVDTAVVEDKAGAGEGHACLLRLELQLDNVVVPCGQSGRGVRWRATVMSQVPLRAAHLGKGPPTPQEVCLALTGLGISWAQSRAEWTNPRTEQLQTVVLVYSFFLTLVPASTSHLLTRFFPVHTHTHTLTGIRMCIHMYDVHAGCTEL